MRLAAWLLVPSLAHPASAQCHLWGAGHPPIGADGIVSALALLADPDGGAPQLYATGSFANIGGVPAAGVARWKGGRWQPLGGGIVGAGAALAAWDGATGPSIYVGGSFSAAGGAPAASVARWDGLSWHALPGAPDGAVEALVAFDDGIGLGTCLFAAGSFTSIETGLESRVARFDGLQWNPLDSGMDGPVRALAVYDDGSGPALYAGGDFALASGIPASRVARWTGAFWQPVGAGTDGPVATLVVHDDGGGPALYAGGSFASAGGVAAANVARFDGASWSPVGAGAPAGVRRLASVPATSAQPGGLYAGFDADPWVRRWDGSAWSGFVGGGGGGLDGPAFAFAPLGASTDAPLVLGGAFSKVDARPWPALAALEHDRLGYLGVPLSASLTQEGRALARFDDGTGDALWLAAHATENAVTGVAFFRISSSGVCTRAGPMQGISDFAYDLEVLPPGPLGGPALVAALRSGGAQGAVVRWDGSGWTALGGAAHPSTTWVEALEVFDDGSGPHLYAGGTNGISRWDGSSWTQVPGLPSPLFVRDLLAFDDGSGPRLYVGGVFSGLVGAYAAGTWTPMPLSFSGSSAVHTLAVHDDGGGARLHAGGRFSVPNGNDVARWDGSAWSGLGQFPTSTWVGEVASLASFDDGSGHKLYAGNLDSGVPVLRWDASGWSQAGVASPQSVRDLLVDDDGVGGADLVATGGFAGAGNVLAGCVMRYHGCAPLAGATISCSGDGSLATPCPCGNVGAGGAGCPSSVSASGADLRAWGEATSDGATLIASGMPSTTLAIFLQGDARIDGGAPLGDGVRCVGGLLKRIAVKNASAGIAVYPLALELPIRERSAMLGDPIPAGALRHYQVYYRDPSLTFCPEPFGDTFNATNAATITW